MSAWDYPISQPYGYDPTYQGNSQHIHYGVDYAAPEGTPVPVNGVTIGLVGHTGKVYDQNGKNTINAAHLHVGHWLGGISVPNKSQEGKVISTATVTEVAEDSINGKYVRVSDADGSSWVYLHLSQQLVTVGQKLEEGDAVEPQDYRANSGDNTNVKNEFGFAPNDPPDLTGTPWKSVYYDWINGKGQALLARIAELEKQVNAEYEILEDVTYKGKPVYIKKG